MYGCDQTEIVDLAILQFLAAFNFLEGLLDRLSLLLMFDIYIYIGVTHVWQSLHRRKYIR